MKEKILKFIEEIGHPIMIPEVCKELNIAYDTAKAHLLHLAAKDQVRMRKIGRHWIFWKKE